jgi:hypothetical protein
LFGRRKVVASTTLLAEGFQSSIIAPDNRDHVAIPPPKPRPDLDGLFYAVINARRIGS